MSAEEEELVNRVLEDSILDYERNQLDGLDVQIALSPAGDVVIPKPGEGFILEPSVTP